MAENTKSVELLDIISQECEAMKRYRVIDLIKTRVDYICKTIMPHIIKECETTDEVFSVESLYLFDDIAVQVKCGDEDWKFRDSEHRLKFEGYEFI